MTLWWQTAQFSAKEGEIHLWLKPMVSEVSVSIPWLHCFWVPGGRIWWQGAWRRITVYLMMTRKYRSRQEESRNKIMRSRHIQWLTLYKLLFSCTIFHGISIMKIVNYVFVSVLTFWSHKHPPWSKPLSKYFLKALPARIKVLYPIPCGKNIPKP